MKRSLIAAAGISAATALVLPRLYSRWFTPWQRNWGSTEEEQLRILPGDDFIGDPDYVTTRAITVNAPPEAIWPWLVQMGYRRGGLYSWDFLDRVFGILDAPSAKRILPEFQQLEAGDVIPVGKGGDFPVKELRANEYLLLAGESDGVSWTWATALYPQADGTTRLVTRNTGAGMAGAWAGKLAFVGMDLAAYIMVRRWLQVLKSRAEGLVAEGLAPAAAPGAQDVAAG